MTNRNISVNNNKKVAPSKKGSNSKHLIFIICVLIASFFWLLIKLSDQYNESFFFKVNYFNAPKKQLLTSIIDTNLIINVEATGFEMMNLILSEDLENLNIDLNKCEILPEDEDVYYITTSELKEKISENIGIPLDQIEISSQKLEFRMEGLFEKIVMVNNQMKFNFAPQYKLYNSIIISPNKIKIFGPKNILDTINSINTNKKEILNISNFIDENIGLINPNKELIHFSEDKVNIKATVEKFTESSLEMPIDLSNINHKIKAFPNTVKVFFTVAQKDFSNIRKSQFKVQANLKNTDIITANKLQLEIIEKPDFVNGIRIQPSEIEFLIIK